MKQSIRKFNAYIVAPYMAYNKKYFSKAHRHENTIYYRLIDTVRCNAIIEALIK